MNVEPCHVQSGPTRFLLLSFLGQATDVNEAYLGPMSFRVCCLFLLCAARLLRVVPWGREEVKLEPLKLYNWVFLPNYLHETRVYVSLMDGEVPQMWRTRRPLEGGLVKRFKIKM